MRTKSLSLIVMLAIALATIAIPVAANLVPTSFGFPVIVQNGSTSAFNQDTASAADIEIVNIDFPLFGNGVVAGPFQGGAGGGIGDIGFGGGFSANELPFGPVDLAFPSINQESIQTQNVSHTDFAQTNEFAEFAYPFVGVGPVSLPGFGFGW